MNKTIQNTHSHKADITLLLGIIFIEVSAKTSVLVDDENTWNPVIFAALAQFGVPTVSLSVTNPTSNFNFKRSFPPTASCSAHSNYLYMITRCGNVSVTQTSLAISAMNFWRAYSRRRTPLYTWKSPLPAPALEPVHIKRITLDIIYNLFIIYIPISTWCTHMHMYVQAHVHAHVHTHTPQHKNTSPKAMHKHIYIIWCMHRAMHLESQHT